MPPIEIGARSPMNLGDLQSGDLGDLGHLLSPLVTVGHLLNSARNHLAICWTIFRNVVEDLQSGGRHQSVNQVLRPVGCANADQLVLRPVALRSGTVRAEEKK